jgi:hypothetical protein
MPILMVALIALAAFGIIGFLLTAAVLCEPKTPARASGQPSVKGPSSKPAA